MNAPLVPEARRSPYVPVRGRVVCCNGGIVTVVAASVKGDFDRGGGVAVHGSECHRMPFVTSLGSCRLAGRLDMAGRFW